jgi:hypothetical protein
MGYLNNQVVTVDAILTKKGRELLAKGDGSFNITQFALSDDEVDYTLYNPNHPSGSAYYGEAIENMPLLEAFPDENQMMKYKLVSLVRGTAVMPVLNLGRDAIRIGSGVRFEIVPTTSNYQTGGSEPSGYQFTISDVRVFNSFDGVGGPITDNSRDTIITNGTSTSQTVLGASCQGFGTAVPTLFSGNSTIYATMTVIGLDSGARGQLPVVVTYNASPNSQEA